MNDTAVVLLLDLVIGAACLLGLAYLALPESRFEPRRRRAAGRSRR